jgi:hypothetical protein
VSAKRTWLALAIHLLCACEAEVIRDGDELALTMLMRTKALVVAVPAIVALVGVAIALLQRRYRRDGMILALATVAVAGTIVPGILFDRVTATPTGIWQRTGFWFASNVKGFDYADVRSIRIETRHERKSLPNDIWILTLTKGGTRELDPGDLWSGNDAILIPLVEAQGIPITRG